MELILEGRIAGPWTEELRRTWAELEPVLGPRKLFIDLCNTTYADESGIHVLRAIHSSSPAQFRTSTPWAKYLAEEVTRSIPNPHAEE